MSDRPLDLLAYSHSVRDRTRKDGVARMRRALIVLKWAPILTISAIIPLAWILLPYMWSDFKEDLSS